jgi:hypothetical protein
MQCGDQLIHFRCHDCHDIGAIGIDGGEGVDDSGRNNKVFTLFEDSPLVAKEHFKAAPKHDKGFVGLAMQVRRRLIAGVVGEVPRSDHEVIHAGQRIR